MSIPACLKKYQDLIVSDMHNFLDGSEHEHVKMIYYHLGWLDSSFCKTRLTPGKLSRPSITLLVTNTLGGNVLDALPAASAIQIFHDFTLMHDDIEDGDFLRRHRETVWKIWGVPRAVNAGDAMYTFSIQGIMRVKKNRDQVMSYLLSIFQEIVYGQELDMSFVSMPALDVSVDNYMKMITGKSAELIGASAKVGAIISGADETIQQNFYQFGKNLGIAYQIFDDFISIWGGQSTSGKIEHMDIVEKKKTLPILLLFQSADGEDRKLLNKIYTQEKISSASVKIVLDSLEKYKIKNNILQEIIYYKNLSINAINNLNLDESKATDFISIVNWLIPEII